EMGPAPVSRSSLKLVADTCARSCEDLRETPHRPNARSSVLSRYRTQRALFAKRVICYPICTSDCSSFQWGTPFHMQRKLRSSLTSTCALIYVAFMSRGRAGIIFKTAELRGIKLHHVANEDGDRGRGRRSVRD